MFKSYDFIYQRLIRKMIPTPIPRISTLVSSIHIISNLISRIFIIPLIPFANFPFRLFQKSFFPLHFPKLKFIVDLKFNLVL